MDDENNIITLTDEDGTDMDFEMISMVEMDGARYAVLQPVDQGGDAEEGESEDAEEVEVVVLKVTEENGEETLSTVDDDDEMERAFQLFLDQQDAEEADGGGCDCGCDDCHHD